MGDQPDPEPIPPPSDETKASLALASIEPLADSVYRLRIECEDRTIN